MASISVVKSADMQSMMGDRSYFKINMDKTVHTNRISKTNTAARRQERDALHTHTPCKQGVQQY
jgi:hypothetical protein